MLPLHESQRLSPHTIASLIDSEDIDGISRYIGYISKIPGKRVRQEWYGEFTKHIVKSAFAKGKPELFVHGIEKAFTNHADIAYLCMQEYCTTKRSEWLPMALRMLNCIRTKKERSDYLKIMSEELIDFGIARGDPDIIFNGISFIHEINFKKTKKEAIIQSVPKITDYAARTKCSEFLEIGSDLLSSVQMGGIRSGFELRIIQARAAISIETQDLTQLTQAFLGVGEIPQKNLQYQGFRTLFQLCTELHQETLLFDIEGFIRDTIDLCNEETTKECISAYTSILISHYHNPDQLTRNLSLLFSIAPGYRFDAINSILKELQKKPSPVIWDAFITEVDRLGIRLEKNHVIKVLYLCTILNQEGVVQTDPLPVYKMIKDEPSVYFKTPAIFSFIEHLNRTGYADEAFTLISRLYTHDRSPKGIALQTATALTIASLSRGDLTQFNQHLLPVIAEHEDALDELILRALRGIAHSRQLFQYEEFIGHFIAFARLHSDPDKALSSFIQASLHAKTSVHEHIGKILTVIDQISNNNLHDLCLSHILIRIAREGVNQKNRDIIQQALAYGCMIGRNQARFDTLVAIIDEITSLGTRDEDLELLKRTGKWCLELLPDTIRDTSMNTVISGMIHMGRNSASIEALSAAYDLTYHLDNLANRHEWRKACIISYTITGCERLESRASLTSEANLQWSLTPFTRAVTHLREGIDAKEQAHTIAAAIDTILDYARSAHSLPYIIPLTLFLLEEQDTINRKAILLRSTQSLSLFSNRIDLNNPYDTIASIIEEVPFAHRSGVILGLIHRTVVEIPDPYVRLFTLCTLVESYHAIGEETAAQEIVDDIYQQIESLEPEKAIDILTTLAGLMSGRNTVSAREYILEAHSRYTGIPADASDRAARWLIEAQTRYREASGDGTDLVDAISTLLSIKDPAEYVPATMCILSTLQDDTERSLLIQKAYKTLLNLDMPYTRAKHLIDFISSPDIQIPWEQKEAFIRSAIQAGEDISIPFIISTIKKRIILLLVEEGANTKVNNIDRMIQEIFWSIDDETVRIPIAEEYGCMVLPGSSHSSSQTPQTLLETCMNKGKLSGDLSIIERAIQLIPDRGVRAQYYMGIAMILLERTESRRVEQLIQQAIQEAGVIRPLKRRAYYQCDLALRCYLHGEYEHAGNIVDMAMNTATKITSADERDQVYYELGVAMQVMMEMDDVPVNRIKRKKHAIMERSDSHHGNEGKKS